MFTQLSDQEKKKLRQRYGAQQPKDRLFNVWLSGLIIYGPQPYGLCDYFIKLHRLNIKPKEMK